MASAEWFGFVDSVIRLVAALAGVRRVVIIATDMAFSALVGNRDMRSRQWPNRVVVKSCRYPSRLRVAILAIRRETRRFVVGVRRGIVISQVAADACVRRIVVITGVAFGALVRYGSVSTRQHIILVVDGEGRWFQSGAVVWQSSQFVGMAKVPWFGSCWCL